MKNREYIYTIKCLKNDNFYIGFTTQLNRRKSTHFQELRNKIHRSKLMQQDYNTYGEEAFIFDVLIEGNNLLKVESRLINSLNPKYNRSRFEEKDIFKELHLLSKKIDELKIDTQSINTDRHTEYTNTHIKISLKNLDEIRRNKELFKHSLKEKIKSETTITELAKNIGMSQGSLSRVLSPGKSVPRIATIKKIFKALDIEEIII